VWKFCIFFNLVNVLANMLEFGSNQKDVFKTLVMKRYILLQKEEENEEKKIGLAQDCPLPNRKKTKSLKTLFSS
jgi:hypothetical protein